MTMSTLLHAACAMLYVLLAVMALTGKRRDRTAFALSASCIVTALWAAGMAVGAASATPRAAALLELGGQAAWSAFVLHLYHRSVPNGSRVERLLRMLGAFAIVLVAVSILVLPADTDSTRLPAEVIYARLALAVCVLLLLENLYRNTLDDLRWHIALPCVAIGGLFAYDLILYSDAALFRRIAPALADGRAVVTALATPLLAVSAVRNRRRWGATFAVSHQAVFYSASLVVVGVFLLALAAAGVILRELGPAEYSGWTLVAQVSLICGGVLAAAVFLTSASARSTLRHLVINNFLTHRYDYRVEWLRCIRTLSQTDHAVTLHTRVIKTVAQTVDSPAGAVFLREPDDTVFRWAGSWNLPQAAAPIALDHPLVPLLRDGKWIVVAPAGCPWIEAFPELWLAVPLCHAGRLTGFVLVAPPRAPFVLDQEVFALLRIVGQEIGSFVAEQRAAEALVQTMQLREYGQRFAFVAHDIKNVSSQLSLLLANAEHHIGNPEFQRDMLATIGGSVQKISALLARLKAPAEAPPQAPIAALARINALIAAAHPARRARIRLQHDAMSGECHVVMAEAAFDAVMTHLLDNAFDASAAADPVHVTCLRTDNRVLIGIADRGVGMTAEFIREHLFRPFTSSKHDGFGIGVYQARELLRQAGGDLIATSEPNRGTTMQIVLPAAPAFDLASARTEDAS